MIRSFIFYTFSSMLCLALWVLYQMEDIMSTMDVTALLASAKHVALFYAAGLLVYLAVTYWIYSRRYERASKGMKISSPPKLRRLGEKYEAPLCTGRKMRRNGAYDGPFGI